MAPASRLRSSVAVLAVLASVASFSGCLDPHTEHFRLSGSFTEAATQVEISDLGTTAKPFSRDVAILESFPPQFQIGNLHTRSCEELRTLLLEKPYLASVSACRLGA